MTTTNTTISPTTTSPTTTTGDNGEKDAGDDDGDENGENDDEDENYDNAHRGNDAEVEDHENDDYKVDDDALCLLFVRPSLLVATAGTASPAKMDVRPSTKNKTKKMPARDIRRRFLGHRSGGEVADLLRS